MIRRKALLMVDLQNDFCPGGNLAVPHGDEIIPLANSLQALKLCYFDLVIATQDWHPANHSSFASNHPGHSIGEVVLLDNHLLQVLWPTHCVQGSKGAAFHPELDLKNINRIFQKGTDPNIDSYSAFYDNAHQRATGLGEYLHHQHINDVYVMGLATDYCVKYSALDAIQLGFHVSVIEDGCKGVELHPGDIAEAYSEMSRAGVQVISSKKILSSNQ